MHKVTFEIPERALGRSDITFTVKRDGAKLGELQVSNGSVVWFPRNARRGYKLRWAAFDKLMQEHGRRAEER